MIHISMFQIHIVDLGIELGKYIFTNNINQVCICKPLRYSMVSW